MKEIEFSLTDPLGLHMRPAAAFARLAHDYKSRIQIVKSTGETADARSMLMTVRMGIRQGEVFRIRLVGEDESAMADCLEKMRGEL